MHGLQQASQHPGASSIAGKDRPQTQMEALNERIGTAKRRLMSLNDGLLSRLDQFAPSPQPVSGSAANEPEPTPGTLQALRYQSDRLADEIGRLEGLLIRVGEIL